MGKKSRLSAASHSTMILSKYKDIVPKIYWDNPSATKRIIHAYNKAKNEGKFGGYWTDMVEELTGIQRADEEIYINEPAQ